MDTSSYSKVDTPAEADGIMFLCPQCYKDKGNTSVGVHSIICWNPSVPQSMNPKPGRWNLLGTSIEDLTLQNGSSSVALTGGCNAHFWINNGEIVFC